MRISDWSSDVCSSDLEQRAAEILREAYPDLYVSLSSEVDPAFREYERTVVTALDAYIKPVVDRYIANLKDGLKTGGVTSSLQIMRSEEHTSELQSLMRHSTAAFCLQKQTSPMTFTQHRKRH